jgi:hypothetical protein
MTGNAIKGEALELHDLSSEELDAVSGGFILDFISRALAAIRGATGSDTGNDTGGGQNDPAQMFQQILQQLAPG